jgi:hypothetical protein
VDVAQYAATVTNRVVAMLTARGGWHLRSLRLAGAARLDGAALTTLRKAQCPNVDTLDLVRTWCGVT